MPALCPTLAHEPAKGNWAPLLLPHLHKEHQVCRRLQRQEAADLKEARDLLTADQSRRTFHSFTAELPSVGAALAGKWVR